MRIGIDTHTHTLASGHAYNTIREMAFAAAGKDLEGLAITEHAPKMPGSCQLFYFQNLKVLPRNLYKVELLFGAELNILDESGAVDLPENVIRKMDISIASIHIPCYGKCRGREKNTEAYLNAMQKDYIDIIGHPDDGRFEIDYEALVDMAKKTGTLLELNNSSQKPDGFRENTYENACAILELCKRKGAMITLASDAHADVEIADFSCAQRVLRAVDFPEELIANTSLAKLRSVLKRYR